LKNKYLVLLVCNNQNYKYSKIRMPRSLELIILLWDSKFSPKQYYKEQVYPYVAF